MANAYTVTGTYLAYQLGTTAGTIEPTRDGSIHRIFTRYTSGGLAADTVAGIMLTMPGPILIDCRLSWVNWSATVSSCAIDIGYANWEDPKTGTANTSGVVDSLCDGVSIASGTGSALGLAANGDADYFELDTYKGLVITLTPRSATLTSGVIITLALAVVDRR